MIAKLKDGRTIKYDHVEEMRETNPKDPNAPVAMYKFTRGRIGLVHACPVDDVAHLNYVETPFDV